MEATKLAGALDLQVPHEAGQGGGAGDGGGGGGGGGKGGGGGGGGVLRAEKST